MTTKGECLAFVEGWITIAEPKEGKVSQPKRVLKMNQTNEATNDSIREFLAKGWKLPQPRVILSIVSGTKVYGNHYKDKNVVSALQDGLIKAMKTTQSWVLTNGLDGGMAKIIGDAVESELQQLEMTSRFRSSHQVQDAASSTATPRAFNPVLIGITSTAHLKYDSISVSPNSQSPEVLENEGHRQRYNSSTSKKLFELNPVHTHFILVDAKRRDAVSTVWNGVAARQMCGSSRGVRRKSEVDKLNPLNFIENTTSLRGEAHDEVDLSPSTPNEDDDDWLEKEDVSVPLICVLVKGGLWSLRLVRDHLSRGTPVIVVGGSGGASSVLELAINLFNAGQQMLGENSTFQIIKKEIIEKELLLPSSPDLLSIVRLAWSCVSEDFVSSGLITVLSALDDLRNFDRHLLKSLLLAQRRKFPADADNPSDAKILLKALRRDFLLTVDWNQPEIAEKYIFNDRRSWMCEVECPIGYSQLEHMLLNPGYESLVDLCLSQSSFKISHFLTVESATMLFKESNDREIFDTVCLAEILGIDFEEIEAVEFIPASLNELVFKLLRIQNYLCPPSSKAKRFTNFSLLNPVFSDPTSESKGLLFSPSKYSSDSSCENRDPESDARHFLFLWAVLMCKPGMAFTFWKHLEDPIPSALIAAILFRNMSGYSTTVYVGDQLLKDSKYFVQVAVDVLNVGFENERASEELSYCLFESKAAHWGNRTVTDIAYDAEAHNFFSHPCCQRYLTTKMYKCLQIRSVHFGFFTIPRWLKVIFSAVFIFPTFFWIRFSSSTADGAPVPQSSRRGSACPEAVVVGGDKKTSAYVDDDDDINIPEVDDGDGGGLSSDLLLRRLLRPQPLSFLERMRLLWAAPATRLWVSMLSYMIFLFLFHVALLIPGCGAYELDLLLFCWTTAIFLEVCRHILFMKFNYDFFPVFGNVMEAALILAFLLAFLFFRILPPFHSPSNAFAGRVVVAVGLLFFHYRFMFSFLTVSSKIGPLVLALKTLVGVDFVSFLRLLVLAAAPSAIAVQALLFPGWPFGASSVFHAARRAVFSLFTIALDDLGGRTTCEAKNYDFNSSESSCFVRQNYDTKDKWTCPEEGFWPWFFWTQYLVLQKVVLMTLLYALFSTTLVKIKSESHSLWLFRRYQVICKYEASPPLPPPFSPVCYLYNIIGWLIAQLSRCCTSRCSPWCRKRCCADCSRCCRRCERISLVDLRDPDRSSSSDYERRFWAKTRGRYVGMKNEREKKLDDKNKFLWSLKNSVDSNLLLAKTASTGNSDIELKLLLEKVEFGKKTIAQLEDALLERERHNRDLEKKMDCLLNELNNIKRSVLRPREDPTVES